MSGSLLHLHEDSSLRGDASNGGHMVTGELDTQHRGLSAQCIRSDDQWQQIKACFVEKNSRALFLCGFFEAEATAGSSSAQWLVHCGSRCSYGWFLHAEAPLADQNASLARCTSCSNTHFSVIPRSRDEEYHLKRASAQGYPKSTGRNQMLMPNNLFDERHPSRIVSPQRERD
jgi:hypothetical protein